MVEKRFAKLGDYFDCFRIDHILGFFRIWEVPCEYVQGLCGHFNPALPFSREEIEQYGLNFNESRFTTPHINRQFLSELFEENTEEVIGAYLAQSSSRHYVLKPFCDTQGRSRHCSRIRWILSPSGSRKGCLRSRMKCYSFVTQERPISSIPGSRRINPISIGN